jgi:hypothetical protein
LIEAAFWASLRREKSYMQRMSLAYPTDRPHTALTFLEAFWNHGYRHFATNAAPSPLWNSEPKPAAKGMPLSRTSWKAFRKDGK